VRNGGTRRPADTPSQSVLGSSQRWACGAHERGRDESGSEISTPELDLAAERRPARWTRLDKNFPPRIGSRAAGTANRPARSGNRLKYDAKHALGVSLLAGFLFIVFRDARRFGHLATGDSNNLVEGARTALTCLGDRGFVGCGHLPDSVQTLVFPYPLLQYLPAGLFVGVGASDSRALMALGTLSFIAIAAALLVVLATFRERPRHGALVVLALIGSSAVYQATSAFGEGLVLSLVVIAVCAGVRRSPTAILVSVFLASLGKETLAPFVVALVLICARSPEDALLPKRRLTIPTVGAGVSAIALSAAFNVFRFGSVQNLLYLDPPQHTPGIVRKLEFLSAIFVSPSAGVLWFWPLFSALAIAGTAIGVVSLLRWRHEPRRYLPVLSVTVVMLLWFAGLSAWYSPFGWIAYGPRLETPLLGGLAVAYVHTVGDTILHVIQRSRVARSCGLAVLLAGSLQFLAPWRYLEAIDALIVGRGSCPDMTKLDVYGDPAEYYRCIDQFMWRTRPSVFDELIEIGMTWSSYAWVTGCAGCLVLWLFIATPSHSGPSSRTRGATTGPSLPEASRF
jgi:hypothetical protein